MRLYHFLYLVIFLFNSVVFAQEQLSEIFIVDGHSHDLVPRNGAKPTQSGVEDLVKSGVDGIILAFPLNRTSSRNLYVQIGKDMKYVKDYASRKGITVKYVDQFQSKVIDSEENVLQVIPSIEFFDGVFNGEIAHIDQFEKLGIRSITLDNNRFDRLSDNGRSLNLFGKSVIIKMNELGIKIDISHLPELLQLDVIRISTNPVFASHSNCRSVSSIRRNLSDRVLKELCNKGGLVLLTFDKDYLDTNTDKTGIEALLQHINYLKNTCGTNSIGLGSDFGGSGKNAPPDLSTIECFNQIIVNLEKLGFSEQEIAKVMGRNIINYFSSE